MIVTTPTYAYHRVGETTFHLSIERISPWGYVKEKVGHFVLCDVLQYRLLKSWSGRYVFWASPLRKDLRRARKDTAPVYVWFDLHCPANRKTYREHLFTLDVSEAEFRHLDNSV